MPPNLDLNRPRTSPLANVCSPALLDMLHSLAGILDVEGKWFSISHSWDEFFARTNRPDWRRDVLLPKTLFELFPDDEQRQMFRKLLAAMAEGKLEQHAQVVEFGSGMKALHLHVVIRPLWDDGTHIGYLFQGNDVTREHLNRIALLDRDRRMRELQIVIEEQKQRLETVIVRGRERDEKLQELQVQLEQKGTDQTEALARKTLEHSQEVNALHEEIARLTTEFAQQRAELKAECERLVQEASTMPAPQVVSNGTALRQLTGELAEEYGNLLTGVLGHSTLAAAELGDAHTAVEDLRAIERAARTAAKLTRKLAALSGTSRQHSATELKACVQGYFKRHHVEAEINVPNEPCDVQVDAAALEVMLDAITGAAPSGLWNIEREAHAVRLIVLPETPLLEATRNDLLFAQEVARAYGGEIAFEANQVVVEIPLAGEDKSQIEN